MNSEQIRITDAEQLTGLPSALIEALVSSGEIPGETLADGDYYVGKTALLAWCKLYASILAAVVRKQENSECLGGLTARSLVWMNGAGLLSGKDRVRL